MTAYDTYHNKIGVKLSYLLSDIDKCSDNSLAVISYVAYEKRVQRNPAFRLKKGLGKGNEVLISWEHIPEWQAQCKARFGNPEVATNPLEKFYKQDAKTTRFFTDYRFDDDGAYLKPSQQKQYTVNANVMQAIIGLKSYRSLKRKSGNGSLAPLWQSLANDAYTFNDILKTKYNCQHTLGTSEKTIRTRYASFIKDGLVSIIDGRNNNQNAQIVTPEMLSLWCNIYAGQRNYKPTYIEVSKAYDSFLDGTLDIMVNETAEAYNHTLPCYRPASEATVYAYQSAWESRVSTHALRSGDRQKFMGLYEPYHKLKMPEFAGSMISVDDRQPPFEYEKGKRLWFYMGVDVASGAITTWVYGNSKEGIVEEFYRQMVRNYTMLNKKIPYELECESSLNASYKETLLQNGAMFQSVRIEANNARGKFCERVWGQQRYGDEKKRAGWIGRPFAKNEANQRGPGKIEIIPKNVIIENCIEDIQNRNNALHPNQDLYPGLTRWDVFEDKQHPDLTPTNWAGILPHIGHKTKTSMKVGRINLQGQACVVGFDNEVALGERLINVMKKIEGETVNVYWLDDNHGNVLKAIVYDMQGTQICEVLSTLAYQRSTLERTGNDAENRTIMSAYAATVLGYINRNAKKIERVTIVETPQPKSNRFSAAALGLAVKSNDRVTIPFGELEGKEVETLPPLEPEYTETFNQILTNYNSSTASRFA